MHYPWAAIGRWRLHCLQGWVYDILPDARAEYRIPGIPAQLLAGQQTTALGAVNRKVRASDRQVMAEQYKEYPSVDTSSASVRKYNE
jgi:hypothetical protein